MRTAWARWVFLVVVAGALASGSWQARSGPPALGPGPMDPERLQTGMHGHFIALREVHRALLFGNLKEARRQARVLAEIGAPALRRLP